jgi:hypothetical protein
MLYLSHGKAKEKREKIKRVFPECQMPRHSGKAKFKKKTGMGLPQVLGHLAFGEG